jgi:hypothetical protein
MIEGRCLCGRVAFAIEAVGALGHCHCSMCRKAHGAAFASWAVVPVSAFRWRAGEATLTHYRSSPEIDRTFCPTCGANAPAPSPDGKSMYVPAGLLDGEVATKAQYHIFVGSKAPWWEITDTLPQFAEFPPQGS